MEDATAPSAPDTTDATPDAPDSDLIRGMAAIFDAEAASAQESAPEAEKPEAPKADAKADEPEAKPEAKPDDEDPRAELERARLQSDLRRFQSEAAKHKATAEEVSRKYADLEQLAKQNPVKLIEKLSGLSFQQFMERTISGDFDDNAPKLPPELEQKLKLVEQWEQERAEAAKQAQRKTSMDADRPRVAALIDEAQFPIMAARPDGVDVVLEIAYEMLDKGERPNVPEIIAGLERAASDSFSQYLSQPKMIAALLNNAAIKKAISEAMGQPAKQAQEPTRLSLVGKPTASMTEVPSRSERELTDDEEREELARELRRFRETAGALR